MVALEPAPFGPCQAAIWTFPRKRAIGATSRRLVRNTLDFVQRNAHVGVFGGSLHNGGKWERAGNGFRLAGIVGREKGGRTGKRGSRRLGAMCVVFWRENGMRRDETIGSRVDVVATHLLGRIVGIGIVVWRRGIIIQR